MLTRRFLRAIYVLLFAVFGSVHLPVADVIAVTSVEDAAGNEIGGQIPNLATRVARLEQILDQRRKQEGIPGLALAIVFEDKVVYLKGLGLRDIQQNLPVTPDTLFEIGSTTKAFTAMAAAISVDEGRLQLDDSPKKYLPYFKLRDPEADAGVTIRDLLSHRTGLKAHDDAVWLENQKLSRQEVIKAVMLNKPTAKFREKFQYNNVMYTAAGECVASAQKSTWEDVIRTRILQPLGMNASAPTLREVQDRSVLSFCYRSGSNARITRRSDLYNVAPAGAIVSSARDMTQWLRLMLGGGVIDGKRLVSEQGYRELLSSQINVTEEVDYGLGWGLFKWHDRRVVSHNGGTEGFSSLVEFFPQEKIGFVILVNVPEPKLLKDIRGIVWGCLLDMH
jgi:CubicO group peptidase (beta-lactamase class C family)